MKQFTYLLTALFLLFTTVTLSAQNCTNHVKNPEASKGNASWEFYWSPNAKTTIANGNSVFVINPNGSHITQDIEIPEGSNIVYINGWVRNAINNVQIGNADLHAYVMNAEGNRILDQISFFENNRTTNWKNLAEKKVLPPDAKVIRLFLRFAPNDTDNPIKNTAYFDNLVVSFDCELHLPEPPPFVENKPCKNYVKNNSANNATTNWQTYGRGSGVTVTANRNKSFIITAEGTHIIQDVEIPAGSNKVYVGGWIKNGVAVPAANPTNGDIQIYIMDGGNSILDQTIAFGDMKSDDWKYNSNIKNIPAGAKKIRLILRYHATNLENKVYFDNLVISFDCKKGTPHPEK